MSAEQPTGARERAWERGKGERKGREERERGRGDRDDGEGRERGKGESAER